MLGCSLFRVYNDTCGSNFYLKIFASGGTILGTQRYLDSVGSVAQPRRPERPLPPKGYKNVFSLRILLKNRFCSSAVQPKNNFQWYRNRCLKAAAGQLQCKCNRFHEIRRGHFRCYC